MADLYATKHEEEELEDQIKLLQDGLNLDNNFKIDSITEKILREQ
jgi:hypothetical protein